MSHEILKAKNEISMVLRGRKSIAPIFFPFLTLGCGQPSAGTHPSSVSLLGPNMMPALQMSTWRGSPSWSTWPGTVLLQYPAYSSNLCSLPDVALLFILLLIISVLTQAW